MKFANKEAENRFKDLHPAVMAMAIDADMWSQENYDKEITLTATVSTKSEDKLLGRVSDTHRTRRAYDVRVRDLSDEHIAGLCTYLRKKYRGKGAVKDGNENLVVYKPHGTGPHLHIQFNRTYSLQEINYGKEKS